MSTSLVASLEADALTDVASGAGDIFLDGVLDGGLLEGVPVFGTLVSLTRAGMSVRDALFRRKVTRFLVNFATTTATKRADFVDNLRRDGKAEEFAEALLLLLERADDMSKADLIGKIMAAAAAGSVDLSDALRISRIIDRSFVEDLRTLARMKDGVERLRDREVPLAGDAVDEFEASYSYEEENNLPHVVDGRLATSAGSIDELLTDIVNATRF